MTSGCLSVQSDSAICDGTDRSRTEHAAALLNDGGPASKRTGRVLIQQIDAACE